MGEGAGVAVSCGVGHRCGSDPTLLWLWCRPAAVAPIRPLAREPPSAAGEALKSKKKKKKKEWPFLLYFPPFKAHTIFAKGFEEE